MYNKYRSNKTTGEMKMKNEIKLTRTDKALNKWYQMSAIEKLEIMNRIDRNTVLTKSGYTSPTKHFRACIKILEGTI